MALRFIEQHTRAVYDQCNIMHRLVLLSLLLSFLPIHAATSIEESLRKWQPGRRIEVTMNDGQKLVGHLGEIQSDRFILEPDNKHGTSRELTFDGIRSVKIKMTKTTKWLIGLAIWAALTGLGALT